MELTEEGLANAGVTWRRVDTGTFSPRLRVPASIASDPSHLARVGARVAGRVAGVPIKLGDHVQRGQTLLTVDTVELHQVTLEYLTAIARSKAADDARARQKQLVEERVGAEADLRRAEADATASSAALKEAEEHLHFLGLRDKQITNLRSETTHGDAHSSVPSPIDGRVVALDVTLGQVLSGSEDVVTVADVDTVWASLRVSERDLAGVALGVAVEVRVVAYPDRPFGGAITFVSDVVDPTSRLTEVRAPIANADGALRPGMSGTAYLPMPSPGGTRWIPVEAVQPHDGRQVVFVHVGGRKFEPRSARVGDERGGFVPLLEGPGAGDDLVVHGAFALRGELERSAMEE